MYLQGNGRGLVEALLQNPNKNAMTRDPAESRTKRLPITRQDGYSYSNPTGQTVALSNKHYIPHNKRYWIYAFPLTFLVLYNESFSAMEL
jgi:hypothetical protein